MPRTPIKAVAAVLLGLAIVAGPTAAQDNTAAKPADQEVVAPAPPAPKPVTSDTPPAPVSIEAAPAAKATPAPAAPAAPAESSGWVASARSAPAGCGESAACGEEGCSTREAKPKYRSLFTNLRPFNRRGLSDCSIGDACDVGGGRLARGLSRRCQSCNGNGCDTCQNGWGSGAGNCMNGNCMADNGMGCNCRNGMCSCNGAFGNAMGCDNCNGAGGGVGQARLGCKSCLRAPDAGWSPPASVPIIRQNAQYSYWRPQALYGSPHFNAVSYPMVYQPTDTTQLGFGYQQVPMWRTAQPIPHPNPNMYHTRVSPIPPPLGYPHLYQQIRMPSKH